MAANEGLIDSVANANIKTIAEAPAFYMAQSMGDSVAHQRRVNALTETALGAMIKRLVEVDSQEAVSESKLLSSDLGNIVAQLGAAVAAIQQLTKSAQTTPPVTAG
jgi:hypothetical protein